MAKTIGKWLYLIDPLIAIVAALFGLPCLWLSLILLLMGFLAAMLFLDSYVMVNFAIRFLLLAAVTHALNSVPTEGSYLTDMFTAMVALLYPGCPDSPGRSLC
jgi:hypothetical protein